MKPKASGSLYDKAYALAIDPQGHLYVGGAYTSNPLTFGAIPLLTTKPTKSSQLRPIPGKGFLNVGG